MCLVWADCGQRALFTWLSNRWRLGWTHASFRARPWLDLGSSWRWRGLGPALAPLRPRWSGSTGCGLVSVEDTSVPVWAGLEVWGMHTAQSLCSLFLWNTETMVDNGFLLLTVCFPRKICQRGSSSTSWPVKYCKAIWEVFDVWKEPSLVRMWIQLPLSWALELDKF